MSKQWLYIIIFGIVVVTLYSGWEIYNAFKEEKTVSEYERYADFLSSYFDTGLLEGVRIADEDVLVKESEIAPKD